MVKMGLSTPMAHGAHGAHGDVLRSRTSPDALNLTHGPFPFLVDWHGLAAKLKFWDSPVLTSLTRFKVSGQSGQQDVLHFLHFSWIFFWDYQQICLDMHQAGCLARWWRGRLAKPWQTPKPSTAKVLWRLLLGLKSWKTMGFQQQTVNGQSMVFGRSR